VEVAIGIDSHKSTLAAAAVDALGRVLGVREFGKRSVVGSSRRRIPFGAPGPMTQTASGPTACSSISPVAVTRFVDGSILWKLPPP
jgi:hypothetical protein